jgi:hypothetical protein
MRVPEEPVCIDLFRKNPVFTSLHLKSPVHVVQPQLRGPEHDILFLSLSYFSLVINVLIQAFGQMSGLKGIVSRDTVHIVFEGIFIYVSALCRLKG